MKIITQLSTALSHYSSVSREERRPESLESHDGKCNGLIFDQFPLSPVIFPQLLPFLSTDDVMTGYLQQLPSIERQIQIKVCCTSVTGRAIDSLLGVKGKCSDMRLSSSKWRRLKRIPLSLESLEEVFRQDSDIDPRTSILLMSNAGARKWHSGTSEPREEGNSQ